MKINNLEFRKAYPIGSDDHYYEIVEWDNIKESTKGFCYTVLRWRWTKEQPDIQFVGDRPFKVEDKETLWKLMKYGQDVIQAEYDLKDIK